MTDDNDNGDERQIRDKQQKNIDIENVEVPLLFISLTLKRFIL